MQKTGPKTVDQYIDSFSGEVHDNLVKLRETIKQALPPEAEEVISYQMPAYKFHGILIYFAAFKDHYSIFIPSQGVHDAFKKELATYKTSKATIPFPKTEPIPFDLITKMVEYGAQENLNRSKK